MQTNRPSIEFLKSRQTLRVNSIFDSVFLLPNHSCLETPHMHGRNASPLISTSVVHEVSSGSSARLGNCRDRFSFHDVATLQDGPGVRIEAKSGTVHIVVFNASMALPLADSPHNTSR